MEATASLENYLNFLVIGGNNAFTGSELRIAVVSGSSVHPGWWRLECEKTINRMFSLVIMKESLMVYRHKLNGMHATCIC